MTPKTKDPAPSQCDLDRAKSILRGRWRENRRYGRYELDGRQASAFDLLKAAGLMERGIN